MKPVIAGTKNQESVKPVSLTLSEGSNRVILRAVDERGKVVSNLLSFNYDGVTSFSNARQCLVDGGYDTTFTKWNENGAMVLS